MCAALAAGHLVISEPLSPTHQLAAGVEYLEVATPEQLLALVERIVDDPQSFVDVQHAGRRAAERFRASSVYPALVRDALADISERGSARRG